MTAAQRNVWRGRKGTTRRSGRLLVAGLCIAAGVVLATTLTGPRSSADHGRVAETFQVPSNRWVGLSGMAAQVQGTLAFVGDCPVLRSEDGTADGVLVLPWGVGVTYDDGARAVAHRITGAVYAMEGGQLDLAGGWDEPDGHGSWQSACESAGLQANINVNSWP